MTSTHRGPFAVLAVALALGSAERGAFAGTADDTAAIPLPPRLHMGRTGRYYEDACVHSAARHCFASRVLPLSFRPADYRLRLPRAPAFGGSICVGGGGGVGASAPPANAMAPSDVSAAYHIPPTSSAGGKIVALVDMPDSHAYGEVTTYRQAFGLGALPRCAGGLPDGRTPCFAAVDEEGNPDTSSLDCPAGDAETGLDMAMVSAACPDCSILLVQMTQATEGPTDQDFVTSSATAARLGAVATSISFGGPEQGGDPSGYTTPGHLVVAASGDSGYLLQGTLWGGGRTPSYPASAPDVLGIGGTTLEKGAAGYAEVVWNDRTGATGSGCSTEYDRPGFQSELAPTAFGGCMRRASTDLSAAASFASEEQGEGIASYDWHDRWVPMVGTSAAAPLVAAILTRIGLAARVADDARVLYDNLGAFNDVVSGSNDPRGLCQAGDILCTAGPGWDGPTGLGTPNATKLAALAPSGGAGSDAGFADGSAGVGDDAGRAGDGGGDADMGGADAQSPDDGGTGGAASDGGSQAEGGAPTGWPGDPSGGGEDGAASPPPANEQPRGPFSSPSSGGGCTLASLPRSSSGPQPVAAFGAAIAAVGLSLRRRRRSQGKRR